MDNDKTIETVETEQGQENKTYTQEEVNELLQREADRRVSEALKKQAKKNEEKVREAEKLAKMNEEEKYRYELEQREKAIEEKEKMIALMENKNEASKILSERGISLELVDFVVADADTMKANIDLLDKCFKQSVKNEVEKRLSSSTPKKNLPLEKQIDREQFRKMSLAEKQQLQINNPELFSQLI